MSDKTPKAWLCKHCNERVDPTMALCWNCRADRDGAFESTGPEAAFKSVLEETEEVLTDEQRYERSVSRGGLLSIIIATCLLPIGLIFHANFGESACCSILVLSIGLYAHGLVGMTHRPAPSDEQGTDIV